MLRPITYSLLLTALLAGGALPDAAYARNGKRVYVFNLDQRYWDVRPGDTLGEIAASLLPDAPAMQQQRLMDTIVELNRSAFINNNPDRLRAHTRLWLPGSVQTHAVEPFQADEVETYTWGTIKRSK